jgi:hypothetical protein
MNGRSWAPGGLFPVMNLPMPVRHSAIGCPMHDESEEEELSCATCRKRKTEDWTLEGQRAKCGLSQTCPRPGSSADPSTFGPEVACQKTASGDIICSNNVIYSADCPHAPKINVPGVAENMPGTDVPKPPPPLTVGAATQAPSAPYEPAAAPAPSGGVSPLLVGGGVLALATIIFFAVK